MCVINNCGKVTQMVKYYGTDSRLESGGNKCGVWIVEEDPHTHFGNGRDVGAHVSSKKTPRARSESGGNKCGVWIAEEDPCARFGNRRCACFIVEDPSCSFGEQRGWVWVWITGEGLSRSFQEWKGCMSTCVVDGDIEDNVT